jgi:hypothetical protein
MSTSTFELPRMSFGVEMELLLKPKPTLMADLQSYGFSPQLQPTANGTEKHKDAKLRNRMALRQAVAKALSRAGIETALKSETFADWVAGDESSLTEVVDARGGGYCTGPRLFDPIRN